MTFTPRLLQLLKEFIVPGGPSALSILLNNLSINRDEVYWLTFQAVNPTADDIRYRIFFNNDVVLANYTVQQISGSGGVSGSRTTSFTSIIHLSSGTNGVTQAVIIRDIDSNIRCIFTNINELQLANIAAGFGTLLYAPVGGVTDLTRIDIVSVNSGTGIGEAAIGAGSVARLYRISPI